MTIQQDIEDKVVDMYLNGRPCKAIACDAHISQMSVDNILARRKVQRDRIGKSKYDKDLVCSLYASGLSVREVADKVGGSHRSVADIVRKCGISRSRQIRACVYQKKVRRCSEFNAWFRGYLDGLIISDGCLRKPYPLSIASSYTHSSISREWLDVISGVFAEHGIETTIVDEQRRKKKKHQAYVLRTVTYDQFYVQYNRWYNNGTKIVPRDIDLDDVNMVKNWMYGDGTLLNNNCVRLCCDSFCVDDVDFLASKFHAIGFGFDKIWMGKSKTGNDKWRLVLNKTNGLLDFYKWLGKPEVKYFEYKWAKTGLRLCADA